VDEFWVCQHCRSLNRAGTGRCYHCKQKFGTRPKEVATLAKKPPAPAIAQYPGGTTVPGPVGPKPVTTVAGFGVPIGGTRAPAQPEYLSRPAAAPAPIRDFSAANLQPKPERHIGLASPKGWLGRRISWALATRPFVSVWFVGYVSAVLLTLLLLDGALIVTTLTPVGRTFLSSGSVSFAWSQVDKGHQWMLEAMAIALVAFGALSVLFHSLFLGLSTHNAAGLQTETTYLTPYRAGMGWPHLLWAHVRLAAGLLVPAALIWEGYPLPGLIAALVAVELGQRRLDDPFPWITEPSHHVTDLYTKLGVSGASRSLLGSAWSFCFVAANFLAMVLYAVPLAGLIVVAVAGAAGRADLAAWPTSDSGPIQLGLAALAGALILTTSASIGLLVPVTIELVERQRTRRTLARVGHTRPWAVRPGYRNAPARDDGPTRYDPDGRYGADSDQASLNSPSTTSSFPWEEDVSEEGPLPD
jgi:hypothetical protein